MKQILLCSVLIIAGISIGYIVAPKRDKSYEQSLKDQIKQEQIKAEEYNNKMTEAMQSDLRWQQIEKKYMDSLKVSRKETTKWKSTYENINKTPAPQYTSNEIDSLISAIIR